MKTDEKGDNPFAIRISEMVSDLGKIIKERYIRKGHDENPQRDTLEAEKENRAILSVKEDGAGLVLVAKKNGMKIDDMETMAEQEQCVRKGKMITEINGNDLSKG